MGEPDAQDLLRLADGMEAIGIDNARTCVQRGGGAMWAQMAADCLMASAALRARAHSTKDQDNVG